MRFVTPALLAAETLSPPPTTTKAPLPAASAISSAMVRVPLAKASISNTPMGPFQRRVRALRISSA